MDGNRHEIIDMLKKRLRNIKKEERKSNRQQMDIESQASFIDLKAVTKPKSFTHLELSNTDTINQVGLHVLSGDILFIENHPGSPMFGGIVGSINLYKKIAEVSMDFNETIICISFTSFIPFQREWSELVSRLKGKGTGELVAMGDIIEKYENYLKALKTEFEQIKEKKFTFDEYLCSKQMVIKAKNEPAKPMAVNYLQDRPTEDITTIISDYMRKFDDRRMAIDVYKYDFESMDCELTHLCFNKTFWKVIL